MKYVPLVFWNGLMTHVPCRYRTLVDLAGLDLTKVEPDVQGTSLAPVFSAPTTAMATKLAYSQIGSCACQNYTVKHGQPPPEGTGVQTWTGQECAAGQQASPHPHKPHLIPHLIPHPILTSSSPNLDLQVGASIRHSVSSTTWATACVTIATASPPGKRLPSSNSPGACGV